MREAELRPNILFVMTDQQRADTVEDKTWFNLPNIDSVSKAGITFKNCVTNSPVCIPARITLATGLYPHNTGVWNNCNYRLPAERSVWTRKIKDAGYNTGLFGKTHLNHYADLRQAEDRMKTMGIDCIDEIPGPYVARTILSHMTEAWEAHGLWSIYRDDMKRREGGEGAFDCEPSPLPLELFPDFYIAQKAKRFIESQPSEAPWFCWLGFTGPHPPWDPPEPYASQRRPERVPSARPPLIESFDRPQGFIDNHPTKNFPITNEKVANVRRTYAAKMALIDDQIGEILAAIETRNELQNTLIVLTTDHGDHTGDYGLMYKSTFLDSSVRIPLVVSAPFLKAQRDVTSSAHVELMDVGALMAEMAGGDHTDLGYARSFSDCLHNPQKTHRRFSVSQIRGEVMYRDDAWKMAVNDKAQPYLLFDLENDPFETTNLAGDPAYGEKCRQLQLHLFEHMLAARTEF